jgi:manganese transport protein
VQAEVIAMATDLAEVIGAALGLHLLFGMPLFPAGLLAGAGAFGILALQRYGFRRLEAVVAGLVGVIVVAFAFEVFVARPDAGEVARHLFVPRFDGTESVLLAVGILGATVMPHVVYLHSALTQKRIEGRNDAEKKRIQRFERIDVIIAMTIAGVVNISMLAIAAAVFFGAGIESIEDAYSSFETELGSTAAILFGVALLASGFSSSSVGTLAGQVVMQGFINRRIPIFVRRAITLAPALIIIALGVDPSRALVISQVVLSFGIPFALVPLVMFTSRRNLMGGLVNTRLTTVAACVVAALISALNLFLLYETFVG